MRERRFRAARVNLIGGQVDYHEGVVVGIAIDREVIVAVRPRTDGHVVARSAELAGTVEIAADGHDSPSAVLPAWGRAVAGVVTMLAEHGRDAVGADLAITSTVPLGAGLSSSAAFEVAVALALCDTAGLALPMRELALVAQRAEHVALGVPCGIQDQLTSLAGVAGQAVRIDCRTLEVEPHPIPAEVGVVVVNSGVARTLEGSPWLARRADSFAVAERLGLQVLRDARPEQVVDEPRGRHVVSEIARAAASAFADALRRSDIDALGPLLLASHASSRDDMEVSVPELDALVEELMHAGAYGARLTGGGFGGCVVALVPVERAHEIATTAATHYHERTRRDPTAWVVTPAAGAGPVAPSD